MKCSLNEKDVEFINKIKNQKGLKEKIIAHKLYINYLNKQIAINTKEEEKANQEEKIIFDKICLLNKENPDDYDKKYEENYELYREIANRRYFFSIQKEENQKKLKIINKKLEKLLKKENKKNKR